MCFQMKAQLILTRALAFVFDSIYVVYFALRFIVHFILHSYTHAHLHSYTQAM